MAKRMTQAQLEHAQEQSKARRAEAERSEQARRRFAWRQAAPVVREWYEAEKTMGCMSLNARQNVEKLIADLEAGRR